MGRRLSHETAGYKRDHTAGILRSNVKSRTFNIKKDQRSLQIQFHFLYKIIPLAEGNLVWKIDDNDSYDIIIGIRIPQILPYSSSFSAGRIRAALLLSRNFITRSPQLIFERISIR